MNKAEKNVHRDYKKGYPSPSLQRLPLYLRQLKQYQREGVEKASCTRIAQDLGLISVQVRKDLSMTGIAGRPKVGYNIDELINRIESFLGWDKQRKAVLVGAGALGGAILGYAGFVEHGLSICAAFDVDENKIGTSIRSCPVYSLDELEKFVEQNQIVIGIITVPQSVAQLVTDKMVKAGIRAIWNYSPVRLNVPSNVVCETVQLSSSFAVLSSKVKNMLAEERKNGEQLKE
ncbi:MAG: redox-sensing transcriptional repressor Rex [Thermoguttaceae bacterium]|nr:redox-sensing transcriptional repressor Rex [Thermoguttaceae bacterium]